MTNAEILAKIDAELTSYGIKTEADVDVARKAYYDAHQIVNATTSEIVKQIEALPERIALKSEIQELKNKISLINREISNKECAISKLEQNLRTEVDKKSRELSARYREIELAIRLIRAKKDVELLREDNQCVASVSGTWRSHRCERKKKDGSMFCGLHDKKMREEYGRAYVYDGAYDQEKLKAIQAKVEAEQKALEAKKIAEMNLGGGI